jgi:hypothetical protein
MTVLFSRRVESMQRTPWLQQAPTSHADLASLLLRCQYRVLDPRRPAGARCLVEAVRLTSDEFYHVCSMDERAALVTCHADELSALATTIGPLVAAEAGEQGGGLTVRAICMRIGSATRGAWCAVHVQPPVPVGGLDGGHGESWVLLFRVPPSAYRATYESLSALLGAPELNAQVYRTPVQNAQPQPDTFWAATDGKHAAAAKKPSLVSTTSLSTTSLANTSLTNTSLANWGNDSSSTAAPSTTSREGGGRALRRPGGSAARSRDVRRRRLARGTAARPAGRRCGRVHAA